VFKKAAGQNIDPLNREHSRQVDGAVMEQWGSLHRWASTKVGFLVCSQLLQSCSPCH